MFARSSSNRLRRWLRRIALGLAAIVLLGVWIGYEFPGWFFNRKSSAELLTDLFESPVEITDSHVREAFKQVNKQAVVLFIRSCDLPLMSNSACQPWSPAIESTG